MKHFVITFAVVAVSISGCKKSPSDGERVKQLEDENARLRRAAGQSAALVPATQKPPQDVIDGAMQETKWLAQKVTAYKVTNNYTRQLKDETFQVYDFEVDLISTYSGTLGQTEKSELTLGFVKRGNKWYADTWSPDDDKTDNVSDNDNDDDDDDDD